jgi:hypothetical protein
MNAEQKRLLELALLALNLAINEIESAFVIPPVKDSRDGVTLMLLESARQQIQKGLTDD